MTDSSSTDLLGRCRIDDSDLNAIRQDATSVRTHLKRMREPLPNRRVYKLADNLLRLCDQLERLQARNAELESQSAGVTQ
ncbi:hypothetical protein AB0J14_38610 [Micromonospora arborensis]|uniref:hypothetical protein n=1 Tax=Micromonospora arborensis TaxID=2116518 RepID=UPI0033F2CE48